jgi:hypothetical protein
LLKRLEGDEEETLVVFFVLSMLVTDSTPDKGSRITIAALALVALVETS